MMSNPLSAAEKEVLRERYVAAVTARLGEMDMTFEELAQKTGLPLGKVKGELIGMTNGDVEKVVDILWPGRKAWAVDALWPLGGGYPGIDFVRTMWRTSDLGLLRLVGM